MIFNSEIVGGSGGASIPMIAPLPTTITDGSYNPNFITVGSPTISNRIMSNISKANHVKLPNLFNPGSTPWEIGIRFLYTVNDEWDSITGTAKDFAQGVHIFLTGSKIWLQLSSNGSSWNISNVGSSTTFSANTWYYFKVIYDGIKYQGFSSTDGTTWTAEMTVNSSTAIKVTGQILLGAETFYQDTHYLHGSLDLGNTYFNINGSLWWAPYTTIPASITVLNTTKSPTEVFEGQTKGFKNDLHMNSEEELVACKTGTRPAGELGDTIISSTPLYLDQNKENIVLNPNTGLSTTVVVDAEDVANYTIVGSPTVSNKIASGFATTSYLVAEGSTTYSSLNSMEMVFHFTTGSTLSGRSERIMNPYDATTGDSTTAPYVEIASNACLTFYSGGSTYTSIKAIEGASTNTEYWVKWESSGATISGYYSTDGETWNLTEAKTFSPYFNSTKMVIGARRDSGTTITNFTGSINLNDCYIKINGIDWWRAYIDVAGTISVGAGSSYIDETTGYLINDATATSTLAQALVHPEDFPSDTTTPFIQPVLSDNGTIGGNSFATAASDILNSSYPSYLVFDGNNDTYWHSASGQPHWIEWYNPQELTVTGVNFCNGPNTGGPILPAGNFQIQYSIDNSNWTTVYSGTNNNTDAYTFCTADLSNNTASAKYWRLYITSGGASSRNPEYSQIGTISISGYTGRTGKHGYVSLIKPTASTTKTILTGIRNPTAAYAGSVCTPLDRAVKVLTDSSLTRIEGSESL